MTDQEHALKLQFGSQDKAVNAQAFFDAFHSAISALKEIDKGLSTFGAETIEWLIVDATSNSPISATIRGRSTSSGNGDGKEVVEVFAAGVEQLNGANTCPPHFTKGALYHLRELANTARRFHLRPVVSTAARTVHVARELARNADWAIKVLHQEKNRYTEYGSLEGILRVLDVSNKRDKLVIVDRLTGHETRCYLLCDELEAKAREGWKKRVIVTGTITVNKLTRDPIKIEVDDIRILRERSELPQIDELPAVDITEGVESSEYIRGLRDAD